MTTDQLASNIEDIILKAVGDFNAGLEKSQVTAYNKLIALIKDLKLDARGNIKSTAENIKLLRSINKAMEDTLLTDTYKKRVANYVGEFSKIQGAQAVYFNTIKKGFDGVAVLESIKTQSIENVISTLTESGLQEYFTNPIKNIITRNITTGGSYAALQEELRTYILGSEDIDGRFLRYTKTITTDSIRDFNSTYNDGISNYLGLDFKKYTGGLKDTSRAFCIERNGKYFHLEEIKAWGRGEKCCGLKLPDLKNGGPSWDGMRKGTNESNITTFRGGNGCNHQFIGASTAIVPEEVIKRAEDKGYYKPD